MIDRTLDPLPRRTPREGRATHSAFGWFSKPTVRRARYFEDVSWSRLIIAPLIALAVLGGLAWGEYQGNLIAFIRVIATLVVLCCSYGILARLAGSLRHSD